MNLAVKIILLTYLSSLPRFVLGQIVPDLSKGAKVLTEVTFSTTTQIFTYSYTVENSAGNTGRIVAFRIDIGKVQGSFEFSDEGLPSWRGFSRGSRRMIESGDVKIVPVAVFAPRKWALGVSLKSQVRWVGIRPEFEITSGSQLSGFALHSRAVPGVRATEVNPPLDVDSLPDEIGEDVAKVRALIEQLKVQGQTIAPEAPTSIEPSFLIIRLISLKRQSKDLGWIFGPGVEGIEKSLDAKLHAAKESISKGNNNAAQGQLKAFINELEAQRGKHINDNAFFLLKTNSEFIISKLGS